MIIDASALVASLARRADARAFSSAYLAAPDLIVPETLNALWRLSLLGKPALDRSLVLAAVDRIRIVPSRPYAGRASELAAEIDHPVYECLYLAVAEAESDTLLTCDAQFISKLTKVQRKHIRLMDTV